MIGTLHPLLGVDKSNPFLELLIDPESPEEILVHFGMHLLEKVRRDRDAVELKMLAGRLYNAGFNRSKLSETFGWVRKTIQSFGAALKSGDLEEMRQVLGGHKARAVLTPERELFVRRVFRDIYPEAGCHCNTIIRRKLSDELGVELSHEALRPIINEEKARLEAMGQREACEEEHGGRNLPVLRSDQQAVAQRIERSFAVFAAAGPEGAAREDGWKNLPLPSTSLPEKSKHFPSLWPVSGLCADGNGRGVPRFLHHAGLLLVRPDIDRVTRGLPDSDSVRQWLGAVLCGAVNIEQSGELDFDALEVLLGPALHSGYRQRERLHQICSSQLTMALWQRNAQLVGAAARDVFLYDPHGIHYTGALRILLGWLGNRHMIAKVYYQDFVHTEQGEPVIAFLEDNYRGMRGRLPEQMEQLRTMLWADPGRKITIVADRAVYDLEVMLAYLEVGIFIITWEKGAGDIPWQPPSPETVGAFAMIRYRNDSRDTVTYQVRYYTEPWEREPTFQRIVIRVFKGEEAAPTNVAVLCTDPHRAPQEALRPILRRWLQENDMLYQIQNFGINQITSYANASYEQIAATIEDIRVPNPQLRRMVAERAELKRKWGRELVKRKEHRQRSVQFIAEKQRQLGEVQAQLCQTHSDTESAELRRRRNRLRQSLRAKDKRDGEFTRKSLEREQELTRAVERITAAMAAHPEEVSRLEYLIENRYRKLNFGPKALFDAVRVTARNIFGRAHAQFRPLYDNYRNDHRLLRELIRAPGIVAEHSEQILVVLVPARRYAPKTRLAVQEFLDRISRQVSDYYHGKPVRFQLQNFGPGT